jgi:hypothetical protein
MRSHVGLSTPAPRGGIAVPPGIGANRPALNQGANRRPVGNPRNGSQPQPEAFCCIAA